MTVPTIVTTVELECHRCNLTIPVGEQVTLTDFGWVHPVCDISNALGMSDLTIPPLGPWSDPCQS